MKPLTALLLGLAAILGVLLLATIDWEVAVSECSSELQVANPAWSAQLCRDLCSAIGLRRFSQGLVELHADWPWRAIVYGKIEIGMTSEMVRVSRGHPIGIHQVDSGREQWVYRTLLLHFTRNLLVDTEALLSVTSSEIAVAYAKNEIAAEIKYEQAPLLVRGTVADIGTAAGGKFYVTLKEADAFLVDVYCYFPETQREKLSTVERGDTLYVLGECVGKNPFWGQIMIENCVAF